MNSHMWEALRKHFLYLFDYGLKGPREVQRVRRAAVCSFIANPNSSLVHSFIHPFAHLHIHLISVNWDSEMAHWLKAFDASPKDPGLIPRINTVRGSNVSLVFNMKVYEG